MNYVCVAGGDPESRFISICCATVQQDEIGRACLVLCARVNFLENVSPVLKAVIQNSISPNQGSVKWRV